MLCATDTLETEKVKLEAEMNALAGMTQDIVAENARIAQNQDDYQKRYNELVGQYNEAKSRYDEVTQSISAKEAQSTRISEFIRELKAQEEILTEFDERLWSSMVEYVTVGRKKEMTVRFKDGTEIQA